MKHAWVWQRSFPWFPQLQVCVRTGCTWRRKRVELRQYRSRRAYHLAPELKRVTRWAYRSGPGKPYRLLLTVPPCSGSGVARRARPGRKAAAGGGFRETPDGRLVPTIPK